MSGLPPNPQHLRAEMARHHLPRKQISEITGMHPNRISALLNETQPLPAWAAHNLGYAVNTAAGVRIFDVDMSLGLLPARTRLVRSTYGGLRLLPKPAPKSERRYTPNFGTEELR